MSATHSPWPFGCPVSWQEVAVPALLRSEVQDGYPKVRRQFTKDWSKHEGRWRLPLSDVAALRTFVSVDCQGGAYPFRMADPLTGEDRLFRWVEPPAIAADVDSKPYVSVSGQLETVFS
jgi:hypothetical protein